MADSLAAHQGRHADVYRPGADHLPDRRPRPLVDTDRRGPGAHRARGGDARGIGPVESVTSHPAYSAAVLGVFLAACVLAVYAGFGWQW